MASLSTCIVTGAAAGNGLAIANTLRRDGHRVVAVDRTEVATGVADFVVLGDVLDEAVLERSFKSALQDGCRTVFLINNAGVTRSGNPQSDADWKLTVDVNLQAPFLWSRYFAGLVQEEKIEKGAIVFIGSLATTLGLPNNPAYHAAKAGVLGLTKSFAYDLGPAGIRVNCVSPGYIHTAMTDKSYNDPTLHRARRRHTLLDRWGEPQDVANAVAFLCDVKSSYITGINLPVDGGWTACGLIENI